MGYFNTNERIPKSKVFHNQWFWRKALSESKKNKTVVTRRVGCCGILHMFFGEVYFLLTLQLALAVSIINTWWITKHVFSFLVQVHFSFLTGFRKIFLTPGNSLSCCFYVVLKNMVVWFLWFPGCLPFSTLICQRSIVSCLHFCCPFAACIYI